MTLFDHLVIAFYFAFMVAVGVVFRRFVTDVSDYFRSGGKVLWWMVGSSAFMVSFSAWTFTGAVSKAYADGWPVMTIYVANAVGFLLNALYFAPRFRQLRVITAVEAIRLRFGTVSEQVFTWLQIPLGVLNAGIWLNAIGVFFAAVFGIDPRLTIVVTGLVVLLIALSGGSWAVLASDFMQALILMVVCAAVLAHTLARIGGPAAFAAAVPPGHLDLGQVFTRDFLGLWCLAMLVKQIHTTNNLYDAVRYLCVKDSRHARWAGWLGAALFLVGIALWFLPPMIARTLLPELGTRFPQLAHPEEAAYIAIAREVLPVGMMGLLASAIFAATMSSMDSGLNKNAGVFVKNFYQPWLRPQATDAHLLRVGKLATLAMGVLIVATALEMNELRGLGLFRLMQRVGILIGVPVVVPLFLGLLVKRTPPWSAWSTVLIGFASSLVFSRLLTPDWAVRTFGLEGVLDSAEREYWTQSAQFFANLLTAGTWFLLTRLFWPQTSGADRARIEGFFQRMHTPVDFEREEGPTAARDREQSLAVGWLAVAYGTFIVLLAAIPNPPAGRLTFLASGAVVAAIGGWLIRAAPRPPANDGERA